MVPSRCSRTITVRPARVSRHRLTVEPFRESPWYNRSGLARIYAWLCMGFGFALAAATASSAMHFATNAPKTLVDVYYGRAQDFAYHFGCFTGGRQGLIAAQLFPYDFDGIVAGAPGHRDIERRVHRLSTQRRLFADDFAANLAFDADKDGKQESLAKIAVLADAVLSKCDAAAGIKDGIIEPPLCEFYPRSDLPLCRKGTDAETCFTPRQVESIEHLYTGTHNSASELVYPGAPLGTERQWPRVFVPHEGNDFVPYALRTGAGLAYSFYRDDPGLLPPNPADLT